MTAAGREAGGAETHPAEGASRAPVPFDAVALGYDRAMARCSSPSSRTSSPPARSPEGTGSSTWAQGPAWSRRPPRQRLARPSASSASTCRRRCSPAPARGSRPSAWPSSQATPRPSVPRRELRRRRRPLRPRLPGSPRGGGRRAPPRAPPGRARRPHRPGRPEATAYGPVLRRSAGARRAHGSCSIGSARSASPTGSPGCSRAPGSGRSASSGCATRCAGRRSRSTGA